jgi:hypothetical protein
VWQAHFNAGYHDGGWSGLSMRASDGNAATLYADPAADGEAVDTPLLAHCPSVAAALRAFACPVRSVRFLRLASGAVIREHRDDGLRSEAGEARLHVPIATNAKVDFVLDGQRIVMAAGECWYLNVDLPHRVHNRGATDRIHLVVDCVVDPWLRDLLAAGMPAEPGVAPSAAQFAAFRAAVLADTSRHALLLEIEKIDTFVAHCVEAGAILGYCFTADDVRAAMRSGRAEWLQRKIVGAV